MAAIKSITNFGFSLCGRFRISEPLDKILPQTDNCSLLAVSNRFGLLFMATNSSIRVIDSYVVRAHQMTKENFQEEIENFKCKTVHVFGSVTHLRCNCDGTLLLATVLAPNNEQHAVVYDVLCFHEKFTGMIAPMCHIKLPSLVACIEWNTAVVDLLAICCSNGQVIVIQIKDADKFTVEASLNTSNPKATCLSWSPKGKQLVIGFDDCSLCQFKPNLQPMKKIEPAPEAVLGFHPEAVTTVCWLSTTHFAVVYATTQQKENKVSLCHVIQNKDGPVTYKSLDDVCCSIETPKKPSYHLIHIAEWKLIICCSASSIESAVVGWNFETKSWEVWTLDEELRAELPLNKSSAETFPVGCALDFVAMTDQSAPILLLYSTDGLLCPFKVVHPFSKEILCKQREVPTSFNNLRISKHATMVSNQSLPVSSTVQTVIKPSTISPQSVSQPAAVVHKEPMKEIQADGPAHPPTIQNAPDKLHLATVRVKISKAIEKFESDLRKSKNSLMEPLKLEPYFVECLPDLSRQLEDARDKLLSLKEAYECAQQPSNDLSRGVVENRILAENCRSLLERHGSIEQESLWREKPLTPAQEKLLTDLTSRIKFSDESMDHLIFRINQLLSDLPSKQEKTDVNPMQLAYQTLTNMQSIILLQKQKISEIRKYRKNISSFDRSTQKLCQATDSHESAVFTSSLNSTKGVHVNLACGETQLKKFLQSRTFVPRRRTAPLVQQLEISRSVATSLPNKSLAPCVPSHALHFPSVTLSKTAPSTVPEMRTLPIKHMSAEATEAAPVVISSKISSAARHNQANSKAKGKTNFLHGSEKDPTTTSQASSSVQTKLEISGGREINLPATTIEPTSEMISHVEPKLLEHGGLFSAQIKEETSFSRPEAEEQQGFGNLGSSPKPQASFKSFDSPATFGQIASPIAGALPTFGSVDAGNVFGGAAASGAAGGSLFGSNLTSTPSSVCGPTTLGALGGTSGSFATVANAKAIEVAPVVISDKISTAALHDQANSEDKKTDFLDGIVKIPTTTSQTSSSVQTKLAVMGGSEINVGAESAETTSEMINSVESMFIEGGGIFSAQIKNQAALLEPQAEKQLGFGSLGVSPKQQTSFGSFGSPAIFGQIASPIAGASPTFGSIGAGSVFGGAPSFGAAGSPFGGGLTSTPSVFGGSTTMGAFSGTSGGFAAFAKASVPSFGSLAGGGGSSSPSTFGSQAIFGSIQRPAGDANPTPSFSQWRG